MLNYVLRALGLRTRLDPATVAALRKQQEDRQIKNIVHFMKNDAMQRYDLIKEQTEHDSRLITINLVRAEKLRVENEYKKRLAQVRQDLHEKTVKAKQEHFLAKQEVLNDCLDQIRDQVKANIIKHLGAPKNIKHLEKFLVALILEAACMMRESQLYIKVRPQDEDVVRSILPLVERYYREEMSSRVEIGVLEARLDETCLGGVVVTNAKGHVEIDNRVENRIELGVRAKVPLIRKLMPLKKDTLSESRALL